VALLCCCFVVLSRQPMMIEKEVNKLPFLALGSIKSLGRSCRVLWLLLVLLLAAGTHP
jgi:hypothetical protein